MRADLYTARVHDEVVARLERMARGYTPRWDLSASDRDDLVGIGLGVAIQLWKHWLPSKGKFPSYVATMAKHDMWRFCESRREAADVPRRARARLKRTERGKKLLRALRPLGDEMLESVAQAVNDQRDTAADRLAQLATAHVGVAMLLECEAGGNAHEVAKRHGVSGKGVKGGASKAAAVLRNEGRAIIDRDPELRRLLGVKVSCGDAAGMFAAWAQRVARPLPVRASANVLPALTSRVVIAPPAHLLWLRPLADWATPAPRLVGRGLARPAARVGDEAATFLPVLGSRPPRPFKSVRRHSFAQARAAPS